MKKLILIICLTFLGTTTVVHSEETTAPLVLPTNMQDVRIDKHLGEIIDLDLTFYNERGDAVNLKDLITKPTILTLVYYRCPGVCTPILNELTQVVSASEVYKAGKDFQMVTISFDPKERELDAQQHLTINKKRNLLKREVVLGSKPLNNKIVTAAERIDAASWTFLTGNQKEITAITTAIGFNYMQEKQDYAHQGTVIFLSKEGKIARYLDGEVMLTKEVEFAITDATAGLSADIMTRVQRMCFSFDRTANKYKFKVNRIILGVMAVTVSGFLSFLFITRTKKKFN